MNLPPLYKFLDRNGARLTLGNRTFRHAKPSSFNDLEDLTIQSVFPEPLEIALDKLAHGFLDVLMSNLDKNPTGNPRRQYMIRSIQAALRAKPEIIASMKEELLRGDVYNVEQMREKSSAFVKEINEFMQGFRVLCTTPALDSKRMWDRYAEKGFGAALRIEGNKEKDSKFQLFRPVVYADSRPPLYQDTMKFLEDSLFRDSMERYAELMDRIIYTKTREWEYEQEYRLAIPLGDGETPYDTLPYHAEEVTELYLGAHMPSADKEDISSLGKALNPNIRVYQVYQDNCGALTW